MISPRASTANFRRGVGRPTIKRNFFMRADATGASNNYSDLYSSQEQQPTNPSQNGNGPDIKPGGNSFNRGRGPGGPQNSNNPPQVTTKVETRPSPSGNPNDPPVTITTKQIGNPPPNSPPLTRAPENGGTDGQQAPQNQPQVTTKVETRPSPSGNPNDPPVTITTKQIGNPPPGSPPLTRAPENGGADGQQAPQNQPPTSGTHGQQNQTPPAYPPYNPGTNYPQGSIVTYNGNLYVKSAGDFSGAAPNGDWLPGFAWHGNAP
jgi:hypothetical protein